MDTTRDRIEFVIVSAQIPATARLELERLAREADRTLSAEIRRALTSHVGQANSDEGEPQDD